ncbi:MAG: PorT family protein [Bacteroidales bacterium]|nr:MAG: PorT family protein [Bacteroidales bacterium]
MKIKGLITLLIIISQCLLAQEFDTLDTEQEEVPAVILDDSEDEISVGMKEIIKFDEKGDTTRIKIRNKEFSVIEGDTTKLKFGDKEFSVIEDEDGTSLKITESDDDKYESKRKKKKFKGHWSGIEFGLNNFVDDKFSMSRTPGEQFMDLNTGRSWNFNWNIKQYSVGFGSDRVGLVTGIGLEFNNYHFDGNNNIQEVDGNIITKDDYPSALSKSKLRTTFLTVPLLFELQLIEAKRSKRFFISAGAIGGLKLGSQSKVIYKVDGNRKKDKTKDDFNINPLRYGLTARIGYRALKFYANYYLTPFFEKDGDPQLYPVSLGLSLAF